jgi:[protein-PII] uridylyltransferase
MKSLTQTEPPSRRNDMLDMDKRFDHAVETLKQKRQRLIQDFLEGHVPTFHRQHAGLLDDYFRDSFGASAVGPRIGISKNPYAIIALGGYGRAEQCVASDVDLLFLFKNSIHPQAEALIREIVYPLWDAGLDVGHATRSVKDCISLASQDVEVLTPLLDARFICGMSPLYTEMVTRVREKVIRHRASKIISWLVATNQARHEVFGDGSYLLEPNLKEGQGGLRDYHTMLWIARIKFDLKQPRDLEYLGLLSNSEYETLTGALDFIWNVRSRLHGLVKRKYDQLHFEHQLSLADRMGYRPAHGQQPVERLMGELHGQMAFIKHQHQMFLYELARPRRSASRIRRLWETVEDGLHVVKDTLHFHSPEAILKTPELLMQIFEESARLKIPLSAEAKRLVSDFSHLVDDTYRASVTVIKSFERILMTMTPAFNVLGEMLSTGFLVSFFPEMSGIVNRIQYDAYHLYPVDRHCIRTVQAIKRFGKPEDDSADPLCGKLWSELHRRKLLLWAALFHDIGKGKAGADHSHRGAVIVAEMLAKRGFSQNDIETVAFLVAEHLFLIKTATRRDLNDEETAIVAARRIKDVNLLKMLYLLTVADSLSTGPKAWNSWTAALLRDLFLKVVAILSKQELVSTEAVDSVEKKKAAVLATAESDDQRNALESLLGVMPPRYLLSAGPSDIQSHIDLHRQLGNDAFVWRIDRSQDAGTRTVTVCAKDRPGIFSKFAGVFTLNGLDILDAQVYTWRNNVALDIFELTAPLDPIFEQRIWQRAQQHLSAALENRLDLAEALREKLTTVRSVKPHLQKRPNKVVIDNESSGFFTLIEVYAYDAPGLLFAITDAIFRCRLDVWVAKIATHVDQVVDVFYVRDFDGQKVDAPDQVAAIQLAIETALPPPA